MTAKDGGEIYLCLACRRRGNCRLGLVGEMPTEGGRWRFELRCADVYEGVPGMAHGGWMADAFDDVLGRVPTLSGANVVTKELSVRYCRPVPVEVDLVAEAWMEQDDGQVCVVVGELRVAGSGTVVGEGRASFVRRDAASHARRFDDWRRSEGTPPG